MNTREGIKMKFMPYMLTAILLFASCEQNSVDDSGFIQKVDFAVQKSQDNTSSVTIRLATQDEFNCTGYELATELSFSEINVIELSVTDVLTTGEACLPALDPAKASVPLDVPEGAYMLIMKNSRTEERFDLQNQSETVSISRLNELANPDFRIVDELR